MCRRISNIYFWYLIYPLFTFLWIIDRYLSVRNCLAVSCTFTIFHIWKFIPTDLEFPERCNYKVRAVPEVYHFRVSQSAVKSERISGLNFRGLTSQNRIAPDSNQRRGGNVRAPLYLRVAAGSTQANCAYLTIFIIRARTRAKGPCGQT